MKITKITYGLTANLGNYQSARIDLTSQLEDWENVDESVKHLKLEAARLVGSPNGFEGLRDLLREILGDDSPFLLEVLQERENENVCKADEYRERISKLRSERSNLESEFKSLKSENERYKDQYTSMLQSVNNHRIGVRLLKLFTTILSSNASFIEIINSPDDSHDDDSIPPLMTKKLLSLLSPIEPSSVDREDEDKDEEYDPFPS